MLYHEHSHTDLSTDLSIEVVRAARQDKETRIVGGASGHDRNPRGKLVRVVPNQPVTVREERGS